MSDWNALLSSEVFCEYLQAELKKEAAQKTNEELELNKAMQCFAALEEQILLNPKTKKVFKILQEKFATDLTYRNSCHPAFVEGVMMLNLAEDK